MLESDVAQEVIDDFSAKLKKDLLGLKLDDKTEELHIMQKAGDILRPYS
ncbi:MAG: hypothetical protein WA364_15605 [Candidatus Nitrosopolaris sp.]